MTALDIEGARRSFGWWLRHTSSELDSAAALETRRALATGIEDCLLALRDDRTQLPPALRELVAPLRPRTYDAAVRLLLWARHAPAGPRCRSYRAALYLVQQLEADDVEHTATEPAAAERTAV